MPERDYLVVLRGAVQNPRNILRVRIVTDRGAVVDFAAQYEATIERRAYPVVRHDGSHGQGHRDPLDRRGESVRKEWLPEHLTLAQSLTLGIRDVMEHWNGYRDAFLQRGLFNRSER